jgi:2-methylaconitate cis-trans-isomerase PrpF
MQTLKMYFTIEKRSGDLTVGHIEQELPLLVVRAHGQDGAELEADAEQ